MARKPGYLRPRLPQGVEVVRGDVLDSESLPAALAGVETAYYLVHSMAAGAEFEEQDRRGARHFARAAADAGVGRIVYLGGLGDESDRLSPHLRSRHEVGRLLAATGVTVVELRASIVIGSGSLSFEMIRALVERLPFMITPRWVETEAQPIAVMDLLEYLAAAATGPASGHTVVEIGCPERVTYGDLMREYARQRGLRRVMLHVPVLTPRLSSLWLGLVTPVYARIGRILVDSLIHPTVVTTGTAARLFPRIRTRPPAEAIAEALRNEDLEFAETRWSDAVSGAALRAAPGIQRFGNRLVDRRTLEAPAPPPAAFEPIQCIGGRRGWYCADWLWTLRGWLDLLVGGPGMRRGRRHDRELLPGDVLDCWRVEEVRPGRLRLAAEMKLPGRAWLEFTVTPAGAGSRIEQVAIFDPRGLAGLLYWYAVYPLHELVFSGMIRGIARAAAR
jgi:uncharacterized protein YbjT (DUF2867 family)